MNLPDKVTNVLLSRVDVTQARIFLEKLTDKKIGPADIANASQ